MASDMVPRYRTPQELVEALQARGAGARAQMWQLLREGLDRLMGELIVQHGLDEDRNLLTIHALHAAETTLRSRPGSSFADMSWRAFRNSILLQMGKLALHPHGAATAGLVPGLPPLPESPTYHHRTFFRPYARLGNHFFGGDWFTGRHIDDALWVFLADVTGHGYYAYLLASGLPALWQRCWEAHREGPPEPAEMLTTMHEILSDCLPEGIYQ
jgi:hypothetical protein